jgi:site-specific recombinase XerD
LITGGRVETLLHIQKKDVDLENETVTLQDLKNKSTYKGFLSTKAIKLMKPKMKYLKANDYIVSLDGTKTTARQIQSRLKPILDKLFNKELESKDSKNRVVIHTLRHTFASHLAINGTPIFTIQKLMNHKDIKQTMRYAKLAPDCSRRTHSDTPPIRTRTPSRFVLGHPAD